MRLQLDRRSTTIRRQSSTWAVVDVTRKIMISVKSGKKRENTRTRGSDYTRIADSDESNLSDDFTYHCPLTRDAGDLIEKRFHAWKRDWDNDDCYTIVRGITAVSRETGPRKKGETLDRDSTCAWRYWLSAPYFGPRDSYVPRN